MLNSHIREFIKLIVNCTEGYKKLIKLLLFAETLKSSVWMI